MVKSGTAKSANKLGSNLNLAGKTGTTNDYRDAWFAGYSGNYVSVVWVGRDDNQPIGLSGGSGALPIWNDYMGRLRLSPVSLVQPEDIEWLWLDNGTGKLSNEACDGAKSAIWSKCTERRRLCHRLVSNHKFLSSLRDPSQQGQQLPMEYRTQLRQTPTGCRYW